MSDPGKDSPVPFPEKGIDRTMPFSQQPALTAAIGKNVRWFEALEQRGRGGSRPGLRKFIAGQVHGTHETQELNFLTPIPAPLLVGLYGYTGLGGFPKLVRAAFVDRYGEIYYGFKDVTAATDLKPYSLVIVSFRGQFSMHPLFDDAVMNANLLAYLIAGGRVFVHAEFGTGYDFRGLPVDPSYDNRTDFNLWLAGMSATMQVGDGVYQYVASGDFPSRDCQWANPSPATPLAPTLVGLASSNVHLQSKGRPLYVAGVPPVATDGVGTVYADTQDLVEPFNLTIMAIERIGDGFLVLSGDSNVMPRDMRHDPAFPLDFSATIPDPFLNAEFWRNLVLVPGTDLAVMAR